MQILPLLEVDFDSDRIRLFESFLQNEKQSIISKADLEELKSITKPTELALQIIQAFCMLLEIRQSRKPMPDGSI